MAFREWGFFLLYIYIKIFKNLHVRKHWTDFYITGKNVSLENLYQDCSSRHDLSKNMAARGRGLFSLYIYIGIFKYLLVRNHWTDFINTCQKSFLVDPRPRLFVIMIRQKTWPPGGWGWGGAGLIFPLYIYIEKFKNLLVRNQWTNFNITWQECCFGDPLPRLFKPS